MAVVVVAVLVVVALFLVVKLVRKHREVHQPGTPVPTKVAYWVSLAYTVFPFDLLPDPVYFDDIVVLSSGLIFVSRSLTKKARDDRRAD
ncbi:YkvA family protein [Amycolatopsis sp. cmx-11-51]|uniref:YkvA family protein n=1 Tax=unclassified Amycolatopsis TaxID=2618356 RepID=UPI0039E40FFD